MIIHGGKTRVRADSRATGADFVPLKVVAFLALSMVWRIGECNGRFPRCHDSRIAQEGANRVSGF